MVQLSSKAVCTANDDLLGRITATKALGLNAIHLSTDDNTKIGRVQYKYSSLSCQSIIRTRYSRVNLGGLFILCYSLQSLFLRLAMANSILYIFFSPFVPYTNLIPRELP